MEYDADALHDITTLEDVEDWLSEITEAIDDGRLEPSEREEDFLLAIAEQLESGRVRLTGRQLVRIRRLYDRLAEE